MDGAWRLKVGVDGAESISKIWISRALSKPVFVANNVLYALTHALGVFTK